jgi:hypothetical protein
MPMRIRVNPSNTPSHVQIGCHPRSTRESALHGRRIGAAPTEWNGLSHGIPTTLQAAEKRSLNSEFRIQNSERQASRARVGA